MTLALEDTATHVGPHAEPVEANELPAGMRLGHFRVERKLGAGGMGEVYLATDLALDRPVAVKVLPAGTVARSAHERLVREARAQARVLHPNVAHIYFIGEEESRLYFAMEYVSGTTLADAISVKPLPVEQALAAIRGAVLGLREAHRSGITHRDVKPSNLMLDAHGGIKVLDFGLAAGAPEAAPDGPVEQTSFAGTPLYMAPEQARGEPVDLRADIYALGATLYHLVAGAPPFRAETIKELSTLHATAARPALPRGTQPRPASAAIDALVAKMMAMRPEDRFASYDDLLRAIDMISEQRTKPAGFWVRAVAQAIDALLLFIIAALIAVPFGSDVHGLAIACGGVVLSSLLLARWGTTPGKALFELEVVSIDDGKRPPLRMAFRREAILLALPIALSGVSLFLSPKIYDVPVLDILGIVVVVMLIIHMVVTSLRAPGKRTLWDRASHTQVRYRVGAR